MVAVDNNKTPPFQATRVWSVLLTNRDYLPGALTLIYGLKKYHTKYPFVLFYTDKLDQESHRQLDKLDIYKMHLDTLMPQKRQPLADDRFHETWTKIQIFSLTQFERIGVLDCDMAILDNMDELLSNDVELNLTDDIPLAACHACACNPNKRSHYPDNWIPENCAYTQAPVSHGILGPPSSCGVGMINGGLTIIKPSITMYNTCMGLLNSPKASTYIFPDQELISEALDGNWIGLSFRYNALKPLRNIHPTVWTDDSTVKCIHYILSPKPWDAGDDFDDGTHTFHYWQTLNSERIAEQH